MTEIALKNKPVTHYVHFSSGRVVEEEEMYGSSDSYSHHGFVVTLRMVTTGKAKYNTQSSTCPDGSTFRVELIFQVWAVRDDVVWRFCLLIFADIVVAQVESAEIYAIGSISRQEVKTFLRCLEHSELRLNPYSCYPSDP